MPDKSIPLEIERKYLIAKPNEELLAAQPAVRVREILQTYLIAPQGKTRRVRRICEGGRTRLLFTEKTRLTALTAREEEYEITPDRYGELLREADPTRRPIEKRRYAIPYGGRVCEVDIYPFWERHATLEIELSSEEEEPRIPLYLSVLRDVSADRRFKNVNLALLDTDLSALVGE
jgi:CYTH domain-containing protein